MSTIPTSLRNRFGELLDFSFHEPETKREDRAQRLVLLGHGLTGNKDRPVLVAVAEALRAEGWEVLRFSFAGNGGSEGEFAAATISKEVGDLLDLVEQLSPGRRLAYVGHSQGAAVGVLAAARDERIGALVSLAGMVRTAEFYQREFGQQQPGQDCLWDELEFPLSEAYAADMAAIGSTENAAAAVAVPWLLLHGSEDDLVPSSDSRAAQRAAGQTDAQWQELKGADHSFAGREGEVGAMVAAWLERVWR